MQKYFCNRCQKDITRGERWSVKITRTSSPKKSTHMPDFSFENCDICSECLDGALRYLKFEGSREE